MITEQVQQFIEDNIDLIEQNTKESWEQIYDKLNTPTLKGEFTEIMLSADIDPAEILSYIPMYYLFESKITNYEIPNNVTSIGKSAFSHCKSLTKIVILNNVTSIGEKALYGCSSLTSVVIPDSVTEIGDFAFYNCSSLTSVYITDIAAWCNISGLYYLMGYGSSSKKLYLNNELVTELIIPDSVTEIGDWAFYNCSSLTSLVIGNSVTSIGGGAFYNCSSLTSVTISDNVTSIGMCAFCGCNSLTSITFNGTKAEWKAISKSSQWNTDSAIKKIKCIDGVIEL